MSRRRRRITRKENRLDHCYNNKQNTACKHRRVMMIVMAFARHRGGSLLHRRFLFQPDAFLPARTGGIGRIERRI
jgi:hypothetical protein